VYLCGGFIYSDAVDNPIRVLCVDDDPSATAERVEHSADRLIVETATDAEEALARLANGGIDCVVSETDVSGTDALELHRAVQGRHEGLPFVLFTDSGSEELASEAIAAGVSGYVPKRGEADQHDRLVDRIEAAVERARAWRALRSRGELLRATERLARTGGWEFDARSETLRWTDGTYEIHDLDPAEYEPTVESATEFYHPDDREAVERAIERCLDRGEPFELECRLVTAEERLRWIRTSGEPVRNGDDLVGVRGAIRDVTGRHEREAALETLHERTTTIQTADTVESVCELTVTAAAELLEFELCSVLLREGDWLVPYALSEEAPPGGSRRMHVDRGLAGKTVRTGQPQVVEDVGDDDVSDPAKDSYRSGLSVPIGDHGVFQAVETETGAFGSRDVTLAELLVSHTATAIDRIEHERTLTREKERLDDFASFVSHDLRNPLSVANLRLSLAAESCDSEHLDDVEGALDRMGELIDGLLTLARQGERIGRKREVALDEIATRCWATVETRGATLECLTDRTVYADDGRLTSVFENLFRNAVEHSSTSPDSQARQDAGRASSSEPSLADAPEDAVEHGSTTETDAADERRDTLTVTVGELPDGDGFYVADDGVGIPESERDRIVESGYSNAGGTGLGLAIVREIVEAHGWSLHVGESEAGGARFEITGVEFVRDRD